MFWIQWWPPTVPVYTLVRSSYSRLGEEERYVEGNQTSPSLRRCDACAKFAKSLGNTMAEDSPWSAPEKPQSHDQQFPRSLSSQLGSDMSSNSAVIFWTPNDEVYGSASRRVLQGSLITVGLGKMLYESILTMHGRESRYFPATTPLDRIGLSSFTPPFSPNPWRATCAVRRCR